MFKSDEPIKTQEEDRLARSEFSQHLGNTLCSWKEQESLVIGLFGGWGDGKSSIINLAIEHIEKKPSNEKPKIIFFNPWLVSGQNNMIKEFFSEVANELELKDSTKSDKKLAKKFKLYAAALSTSSVSSSLSSLSSKLIYLIGFGGIALPEVLELFNISSRSLQIGGLVFCTLIVVFEFFNLISQGLSWASNFFSINSQINKKTIIEFKNEIKEEIGNRKEKIIVIIDDIDRLYAHEILSILKLVRINGDFPNMIYLLPFDKQVVQNKIKDNIEICSQSYLDKIIQVSFMTPHVPNDKIIEIFNDEVKCILDKLPRDAKGFFTEDKPYWGNIVQSGLKDLFKNIRDVKRYSNSLRFSIGFLIKESTLEINPVDFIAIEAIRVFVLDYYNYIKCNKFLFIGDYYVSEEEIQLRKKTFEMSLEGVPHEYRDSIKSLVMRLFPQIDDIIENGTISHDNTEWQNTWDNELRICSRIKFDSYFTLTPGGFDLALTNNELSLLKDTFENTDRLIEAFKQYVKQKRLAYALDKLLTEVKAVSSYKESIQKNILSAIFDISDVVDLEEAHSVFVQLVYNLLQHNDKKKNFEILQEVITSSQGISGPAQYVARELRRQKKRLDSSIVSENDLNELKIICLDKISAGKGSALENPNFLRLLYEWEEMGGDKQIKAFIKNIIQNEKFTVEFLEHFKFTSHSMGIKDRVFTSQTSFRYNNLYNFVSEDKIKTKIKSIKFSNKKLYTKHQEIIELYLEHVDDWEKLKFN